jgi:hypothetical protein
MIALAHSSQLTAHSYRSSIISIEGRARFLTVKWVSQIILSVLHQVTPRCTRWCRARRSDMPISPPALSKVKDDFEEGKWKAHAFHADECGLLHEDLSGNGEKERRCECEPEDRVGLTAFMQARRSARMSAPQVGGKHRQKIEEKVPVMKYKEVEDVALYPIEEEEAYGPRSLFPFDAQTRLPRKARTARSLSLSIFRRCLRL